VRGLALQGILRAREQDGTVVPRRQPWRHVEPFIRPGVFAFLSEEDTADAPALARAIASRGATCFVTAAADGARCYSGATERRIAPFPARVADPTGAGDCFATAFLIRFAETGDLESAARFAAAAGALAVERPGGPLNLPTRREIEARAGLVAAR
jgi:sugar/nucleoside kinase (ribokinase family)